MTHARRAAALTQVTASKDDPASIVKGGTVLIFTTKNQGGDPKAEFNAMFDKYGDAIIVKFGPDGKIYNVGLMHAGLTRPGGSLQVMGVLKIEDFSMAGGEISGRLTSGGVQEAFRDKFEVDMPFKAKAP